MKYLLSFLLILSSQTVFAQDGRRAASRTPVDSAQFFTRSMEIRLTRLREALDQNNISNMVSAHALLLDDMRNAMSTIETKSPASQRLAQMRETFEEINAFIFDPAKPSELEPYLPKFEEFLKLLQEETKESK